MIVKVNNDGIVENVVYFRYIQGNCKANPITLLAKFPSTSVVTFNFKLPNDELYSGIMELNEEYEDNGYICWIYIPSTTFTSLAGKVECSFQFQYNDPVNGTIAKNTPKITVYVEESIPNGFQEELDNPLLLYELINMINSKVSYDDLSNEIAKNITTEEPTNPKIGTLYFDID